ncbi:MAG TPA: preprotein translocase subunit SecG [Devosia sp.]|jgi:preprotein translocase subunit SecG|nr:preprotein translocase subunit SecG [Devosia sp.]
MENVLLVAYLLIVLALIAVILLQRSEGGGLGMGGNAGGLMTVRGSANLLTRTTSILAALFFASAIGLTIMAELDRSSSDILDAAAAPGQEAPATVLDALSQLGGGGTLPLPSTAADPAPAADASTSTPAGADPVETADPGLALPVAPAPAEPAQESANSAPAP